MKLALLLTLTTVVAGYSLTAVYKPGRQYVYRYEGHVLSGVPKMSNQYAGLKIDSDVVLQFQPDFSVIAKLERIQVFKINNVLERSPNEPLTESDVTPISGEFSDVIKHLLAKPIKFTWSQGLIRGVEFEVDDEYWSRNVKKGIIGLLQVNLRQHYGTSSRSFVYGSRRSSWAISRFRSPFLRHSYIDENDNSAYLVMESDVTGECETKYVVNSTSVGPTTMLVTAIRNFDNCVKKPHYVEGLFAGVYADQNEKDLIQPMVHTDYIITGDRSSFLIKDVKRHGRYFFAPRGVDNGDLFAYIHQTMKLRSTREIGDRVRMESTVHDPTGLEIIIPQASQSSSSFMSSILEPYVGSDEDSWMTDSGISRSGRAEEREKEWTEQQDSGTRNTQLISTIERKMEEIIDCAYPASTDKPCILYVLQLSQILKSASPSDLKALISNYQTISHRDEMVYKKREMLLDTLATQPTPELAVMLLQLVQSGELSGLRASMMISTMSLVVKPTPAVILTALKVYKELARSETVMRRSLLLGVGSLTNRLLMMTRRERHIHVITLVETVTNELNALFEENADDFEKETILKSMGNLGSSELVPILKTIIEDRKMHQKIRLDAIYALRRVAKPCRKEVTPLLLSVMIDASEPIDLRIGAFVIVRNAVPSYVTLQAIVHRLHNERSPQLRTLLYTSLVSMAKYTGACPQRRRLSMDAKLLLKTIAPVTVGIHDSVSVLFNMYNEETESGVDFNVISLKSMMSGLPRAVVANLQATLFGKHRHVAEVGVDSKGIETVLRRLIGPYGLFKDILRGTISVKDILRPLTQNNMDDIQRKIREITAKVMPGMPMDEEFVASWYIHILGHELQSMTITPNTADAVIRKVSETLPTIVDKLIEGYKVDVLKTLSLVNSLVMPTPLGVPLTFNVSSLALLKVDGRVQLHNVRSWSELVRRRLLSDDIKLDVNIHPSVDVVSVSSLGADLRWIAAGASYVISSSANFPVNTQTSLDLANEQLQLKSFLPKADMKLFKSIVDQLTFVKYVPTAVHSLPFTTELRPMETESFVKPVNFQETLQSRLSGVEYLVTGHYSKCGPNWCPKFPIFGKHELNLVMNPKTGTEFVVYKIKSSNVINGELFNVDAVSDELNDFAPELTNYRRHLGGENQDVYDHGVFEPVTPDPVLTASPYKRQVLASVSTSHMERSIKSKISVLIDRQHWLKGQFNMQVIGDTGRTWKVKFNDVWNLIAIGPSSSIDSEEFLHKMKLSWTVDGQEKYIKYKIVPGDRIVNINESLRRYGLESASSNLSSEYKYKYTLDAEISHMDRSTVKYMTLGTDLLKRYLYQYMTVEIPSQPIHNRLIIAAEFIPKWEKMTAVLKSPRETDIVVDAPFYWNVLLPAHERLTVHDQPAETRLYTANFVNYASPPNFYLDESSRGCFVNRHGVTTFDGLTVPFTSTHFDMSINGCETFTTGDCSSAGLFAVLAAGGGPSSWKVRFLLPGHEIEYIWRRGAMVITVNGEEKNLESSQPIIIREEPGDLSSTSRTLYKIEKIEDESIKLECYKLGVTVTTDCVKNSIHIRLSAWSMLQGQLCGTCGNYNQQIDDEFTLPYKRTVEPIYDLLRTSFIPSHACKIPTPAQVATQQSNAMHGACMEKKPLTIRRRHNDQTLICESDEPVETCSPSCRPASSDSWTSVDVCFTCRTENDAQPFTVYRPPTYDFNTKYTCSNYEQRINVPTACTAA